MVAESASWLDLTVAPDPFPQERFFYRSDQITFARAGHELTGCWDELPRNRVVRIVGVDQTGNIGRHGHRVAACDLFQIGERGAWHKAEGDQFGRLAQCGREIETGFTHASPDGGVHTT